MDTPEISLSNYRELEKDVHITYGYGETPFGEALIGFTCKGVCYLGFIDANRDQIFNHFQEHWENADRLHDDLRAKEYLDNIFIKNIRYPLVVKGTNFQINVWKALLNLPEGIVSTYQDIANFLDKPKAVRAVASAIGKNHIGFLIPCHRVIAKSGAMSGYRWGIERKKIFIAYESIKMNINQKRCAWVKMSEPIYISYHDNEWGKPLHVEKALFELFSLETQSAGLSWLTVLKKREGYRAVFDNFDLQKVASYLASDVERIIESGLVIKHRAKIEAIIQNAKGFLQIVDEFGSLDNYFWSKVDGKPIKNDVSDYKRAMTTSNISDEITKDLKKRGFKFVGSVTIYAFMQACGMVDDHENDCFCKN